MPGEGPSSFSPLPETLPQPGEGMERRGLEMWRRVWKSTHLPAQGGKLQGREKPLGTALHHISLALLAWGLGAVGLHKDSIEPLAPGSQPSSLGGLWDAASIKTSYFPAYFLCALYGPGVGTRGWEPRAPILVPP
jgi:hypothetical protein